MTYRRKLYYLNSYMICAIFPIGCELLKYKHFNFDFLLVCMVVIIVFKFNVFHWQCSVPLWGAGKLFSVGKKSEWFLRGQLLCSDGYRTHQQLHAWVKRKIYFPDFATWTFLYVTLYAFSSSYGIEYILVPLTLAILVAFFIFAGVFLVTALWRIIWK